MIGVENILCPVDFSDNAEVAATWARNLAERFGARLHVLYVQVDLAPMVMPDPGVAVYPDPEVIRELRESAQRRLDDYETTSDAVKVLREGAPFVEIIRYAKQNDVGLIVMGTHGRSGVSHLLLGSVAEKVIRKAPCPVLTVRPDGHRFEMP